jgi:DNA (cytosine-5)-methyltransferase 1
MPDPPDDLEGRISGLKATDDRTQSHCRPVRDAICGLPTPVDGKDATGIANHRGIPGARTYPKHSGSPLDWPAKAIKEPWRRTGTGRRFARVRSFGR